MPSSSNQGIQLLTSEDLSRILQVTDGLQMHRDWVIIPIDASPEGHEVQQPDGKVIIHAPVQGNFEPWLKDLRRRLQLLDLGRVPRTSVDDPNLGSTGPHEIRPMGTRNYLGPLGIVR
ncbi:MAG TPA: hypothetical protein VMU54_14755 [Planctomycetota bacterium]|nr:hypothetical protein [Planctomycetota bacterium]